MIASQFTSPASSRTYTYGSTHKHAVTGLSSGESYQYDADGNMTQRIEGGVTYNQTYNAENRLVSVSAGSQTTQFVYDGDGNMVEQINPDNSKTIFVGGVYEEDRSSTNQITNTRTYYPAGGAMRVQVGSNPSVVSYVLRDNLGSAMATTDASGSSVGQERYYPFGAVRLAMGGMNTDKLYTGQRDNSYIKLYDYNSRWYSADLGRFVSPDSIVPDLANPQSLNRYSYVNNSPIAFNDPSGHDSWYCDTASCEAKYIRDKKGVIGGDAGLPCTYCYRMDEDERIQMEYDISWHTITPDPRSKIILPKSSNYPLHIGGLDLNYPRCGNDICRYYLTHPPQTTLHWSFSKVDKSNLEIDILGLEASAVGGKPLVDMLKFGSGINLVINIAGNTITISNSIVNPSNYHDLAGKSLSVVGAAPFPFGTAAAAGSVVKDLAGGFWDTYDYKYAPLGPIYGPPLP